MKNKIIITVGFILVFLLLMSGTYGFFVFTLSGNEEANETVVETASLRLVYNDTQNVYMENILPGASTTKTFTVTNAGRTNISYNIVFKNLLNTFINNEIKYSLTCTQYTDYGTSNAAVSGTCEGENDVPIGSSTREIMLNIPIEAGKTHVYVMEILFTETFTNQNYNQGKIFNGYINIVPSNGPMYDTLADVVSPADYIQYDAGSFDVTDSAASASSFSGKVSGRSRNVGVNCSDNLATLDSAYNGWRVLNTDNGVVKIVHAGTPECYTNSWNASTDLGVLANRDYSEYINSYATRATILDKTLAETVSGANVTVGGDILDSTPALFAGARYFLATANPSNSQHLINIQSGGYISSSGGSTYGIRPVVTLNQDLYVSSGNGTSSSPYVITDTAPEVGRVNQNGLLTGYWENWTSSESIKLKSVPITYNIVALAFGGQDEGDPNGTVSFELDEYIQSNLSYTVDNFKRDIKVLQSRGQKVILSIGGEDKTVTVDDSTSATNFATSVKSIIDEYGLDGIDINIENTISPSFLAQAINSLYSQYDELIITLAPQTVDIISSSSGIISGSYYELVNLIKDKITIVNMQLYNTGDQYGINGTIYDPGTIDFIVAYADIMKRAGLSEIQIGLGVVANSTKTGYVAPSVMNTAITSLRLGGRVTGGNYIISAPFPNIGGIMLFSINDDYASSYSYSNTYRQVLE